MYTMYTKVEYKDPEIEPKMGRRRRSDVIDIMPEGGEEDGNHAEGGEEEDTPQ